MPSPSESTTEHQADFGWPYLLGIARQYRTKLIGANLIAVLAVVTLVPVPLLMPLLVDEVLLNKPGALVAFMNSLSPDSWHGPILYICAILLLTTVMRLTALALAIWQTRQFTMIAKETVYRIRKALLQRLQRISLSEYETLGSGTVASYFVTDLNTVDEFIGASISKLIISALSLVGVSAILLYMHWQLALFIILMNPVVIYFTVIMGKKVKTLKKRENSAFELFQQSLVETLDAILQIRAANREKHYLNRVGDYARNIRKHSASFSWRSDAANRYSFAIFLVGFDSFRAISMLMVVFSDLTIGQMMAVFGYLWFMMGPVQEVLHIQYSWFGAKAALGRINKLLQLQEEPQYSHKTNPFADKPTVGVRLEHICFAYGDKEPVLKDISLEVKAGEKIALVGASGGGKSTLVQVLLGLYPARSGQLYFDDVPVTDIGLDVVRDHVAVVLQKPAMFNDSVRMNLGLGKEETDERLWQALDIAQLKETIEAMPEGLDTVIGQQGIRLSGGQAQRLAIARMILMDPKVIILDEATSALDTETESRLHKALATFLQQRTTFIIAHRLSAVRQADRVYVFEDGHIIEEGSHDQLIQQGDLYSRLYGNQH
ncbi:MAG: ABC transporter ATP-binding protein/permease [Gammaproteobacteria bacterium]|nr:ABC transporter ATP-binding protein/permease [Gammaproteobacteria bacterium]